jgi:hypothetical protein
MKLLVCFSNVKRTQFLDVHKISCKLSELKVLNTYSLYLHSMYILRIYLPNLNNLVESVNWSVTRISFCSLNTLRFIRTNG